MLLDEIEMEGFERSVINERVLLQLKDTPRKAYFKRLNLDRKGDKKIRRFRDSGVTKRGNIWAGNPHGQRVVVKINVVKNKARKINSALNGGRVSYGGSGANLGAHISYVSRRGAGEEGSKAILFDKENEGINGAEFFERSRDDRHHFRMIISPEKGHDIDDFQSYVRDVMVKAEKDLGTDLDWVSAVHYDTDDIHAHVIIRGVNDRNQDLVIARDYIAFGFRSRAQERATELMGERSVDDIQKSIEKEVEALRVTSLDRFIENNMDADRAIDVRKENNFGKSQHYEQVIKGRLRYLESTGLASQYPPGVYTLEEGYRDTLYNLQSRGDILRQLHGKVDEQQLESLSLYSIKSGESEIIEGFVREGGFSDEISDKRYLVIEDMDTHLHYVPVGTNTRADDMKKGALIRIRPRDRSSGKADYNIDAQARANGGIYDAGRHLSHIEKEQGYIEADKRQSYLDAHLKRLETLEQNGAAEKLDDGLYRVPDDVIAKGEIITAEINERESKRFYPNIDVLSKEPLDQLVGQEKKTWLDKELYKQSISKPSLERMGDEVRSALEKRKEWLVSRDLAFIQSNGGFALRDYALRDLSNLEIRRTAEKFAKDFKVKFEESKVKENTQYRYLGYAQLESGCWAIVGSRQNTLQMVHLDKEPKISKRSYVEFAAKEKGYFEMRQVERQEQKQVSKGNSRDNDNDLER